MTAHDNVIVPQVLSKVLYTGCIARLRARTQPYAPILSVVVAEDDSSDEPKTAPPLPLASPGAPSGEAAKGSSPWGESDELGYVIKKDTAPKELAANSSFRNKRGSGQTGDGGSGWRGSGASERGTSDVTTRRLRTYVRVPDENVCISSITVFM